MGEIKKIIKMINNIKKIKILEEEKEAHESALKRNENILSCLEKAVREHKKNGFNSFLSLSLEELEKKMREVIIEINQSNLIIDHIEEEIKIEKNYV